MNAAADQKAPSLPWTWPTGLLGIVIAALGLVMAIGGSLLIARGGSLYYSLAGLALTVAGIFIARRRTLGAWCYGVVVVGTVLWTGWESGSDYWGWVPRTGLLIAVAVLVALLLPRLDRPASRGLARGLAGACVAILAVAFAIPFFSFQPTRAARPRPAPTTSAIAATATAAREWPTYGGGSDALRYSGLGQVDRGNVGQLQRAWLYRTGDTPGKLWGAETTPLKIGDAVYLCSARNVLIALDARTGAQRWRFDPKVDDQAIPYTAACRGVAYFATAAGDEACASRVVEGTLDGRLIAVDARNGRPCEGFGDHGQVDITRGMGEVAPGYVSINSAPTIVRGVIVTGHQVLDGQKRYEPSGVILGYDAVTGALRWAWDMMRPDLNGTPPAGQEFTRGTPNMWTTAVADEQLGYVYLPMGNSTADYWSGLRRPPENEFSSSLVALDVTTGKPVWHFQTVHRDVWDYDLGSQPSLIDFPTAQGVRQAVLLSSKQGDIYVLDRRTGTPLTQVVEKPVPRGGVEPEQRSPTQPFSAFHTLGKTRLAESDMWGISPIDQMICRIQFRGASYQGIFTPPTAATAFIEYPGYNGGSDWGSLAVDPGRGLIVANYNDMPNYDQLVPRADADRQGVRARGEGPPAAGGSESTDPQLDTPYAIHINAGWRLKLTGLLCKEPPYGGIRAIDLATGRTVWDRPLGSARANGPFGIHSMLPIEIGTPNNGGSVVTAGGVVFVAAATDNLIRAIDIETGKTLWQDVLPAGGQATPMVYEQDGQEYIVIVAAGHHFMETPAGDYVVAYALPESALKR